MGYEQSFEERTDYDLSIQKETTEFIEKEVERLEEQYTSLLDDFSDLLSILIDCGDLSEPSKKEITERFFKPKTKSD